MNEQYTLYLQPTTDEAASFYTDKLTVASKDSDLKLIEINRENAGFDLYVPREVVFAPGERKLVSMEVKAAVEGVFRSSHHYWMAPRSSISKTGLMLLNSMGIIDKGYRGELMAYFWNTTNETVTVTKGQRLVQLMTPCLGDWWKAQIVSSLGAPTARGDGGFGSTGR